MALWVISLGVGFKPLPGINVEWQLSEPWGENSRLHWLSLDTWRMDCLRRTHKGREQRLACRRSCAPQYGAALSGTPQWRATVLKRKHWAATAQGCPQQASKLVVETLICCTASCYCWCKRHLVEIGQLCCMKAAFINWLNVTFIELQPLHYHCRRQV